MDQVAQVREKIDIVSFISEYIPVKKAGRNFKALCPFHGEKSPSFVISPERQIWHCFGCNLGGDSFTFLMHYENLEFPEALRFLAKRAGVELARFHSEKGITSEKEKIYSLNHLACEFYHYLLFKHKIGQKALAYLEKRGINSLAAKTFMLGFAPRISSALSDYLIKKKGYKREDLLKAGLAVQRGREIVDFFQGRIIFPLFDHRDNACGFSGRTLDSFGLAPKYINTRETLVYQKRQLFFGLNIAKQAIKKENRAIVVEGELDVMALFQEGLRNVVAVKGTALTQDQVNLLSRFAQKVSLCFDMDSAGQEAIRRSLAVLEQRGLTTTVIQIPSGKDPDESSKEDPVAFKKAIKNDIGIYDFLLQKSLANHDVKTANGKKSVADELLPVFSEIQNEIIKEHYLKILSTELSISYETVVKEAEKIKTDKDRGKTMLNQVSLRQKTRVEVLEDYLLALILQAEDLPLQLKKVENILFEFQMATPANQKIIEYLKKHLLENKSFELLRFSQILPKELTPAFDTTFLFPMPKFVSRDKYQEEVEKTAQELKTLYVRQKLETLGNLIRKKEKEEKEEEISQLKEEFSRLVSMLS